MGRGEDLPVGRRLPEGAPIRADEEHDAAQAVADMLVHAAGGQPGECGGDACHERLEVEALGKPGLGPSRRCRSIRRPTMRLAWAATTMSVTAICHRYCSRTMADGRAPGCRRQAPLVEIPPAELAPVEERHVRGGAAQERAGHRLASERAQRQRARLPPHRLEVDHGPADRAQAHHGAEQGEQGAVRGSRK
jgi:hypothetical protein